MNHFIRHGREFGRETPQQRAEREAAFRQSVEAAKNRHSILDIARSLGADLKKGYKQAKKACCLIHAEKSPSLYLYPGNNNFYCYGCGASGDGLDLIMLARGVGFTDAMRFLGEAGLPDFDPIVREQMRKEEEEEREGQIAAARQFFADAENVSTGDPVECYFRARGLTLQLPGTIRFGMVPSWQDTETGKWGKERPAAVCGAQNDDGVFTAIQRIFVDGPRPDKAACKLSLGSLKGSAVRLGPPVSRVILAEGIEDGLTLKQEMPGESVWIPCGTGLLYQVRFPQEVDEVCLAGQNNKAGRDAVERAESVYLEQGLAVSKRWPADQFDDWNDQLRGITR